MDGDSTRYVYGYSGKVWPAEMQVILSQRTQRYGYTPFRY